MSAARQPPKGSLRARGSPKKQKNGSPIKARSQIRTKNLRLRLYLRLRAPQGQAQAQVQSPPNRCTQQRRFMYNVSAAPRVAWEGENDPPLTRNVHKLQKCAFGRGQTPSGAPDCTGCIPSGTPKRGESDYQARGAHSAGSVLPVTGCNPLQRRSRCVRFHRSSAMGTPLHATLSRGLRRDSEYATQSWQ